jgi:hypothetical protein
MSCRWLREQFFDLDLECGCRLVSDESSCGIIREMSGRRVGRHAQIMPVLHSIDDQEAAPILSSFKREEGKG